MESIENLILGDPVYDCKGRMIRRNFGIKNALVIILIVYGLYSLRGKMAIKSGRRKLRGGGDKEGGSDKGADEKGEGSGGDSNSKGITIWSKIKWDKIKKFFYIIFWILVSIIAFITASQYVINFFSDKNVKVWPTIIRKLKHL